MIGKDSRNVVLNIVSSFIVQMAIIIRGIIMPRLILQYFGSEINGLIASITQFLSFFAVMEGGVSSVILASLYKPIVENDYENISKIVRSAKDFLQKLAIGFFIYMLIFAAVYSCWEKNFGWRYIVVLVLILGATTFIEYYYSLVPQLIIRASDKGYIYNICSVFFVVLSLIFMIICFKIYPQVHFVKFVSAVVYIVQPIFLNLYVNKNYMIDWKSELDKKLLSEKWDGFGINLANIITTNTDVMVLTVFSSLEMISVYSIYYSVIAALKGLVNTLNFGYQACIGQEYVKGSIENLNKVFSQYELLMINISGIFFTCCMEVIVRFISIYTHGIEDTNYYHPAFAITLCFAVMVLCWGEPYRQVIHSAGLFKKIAKYAYVEVCINIVFSLVLVQKFEILGVAAGTLVSGVYRLIANIIFLQHNILFRNRKVAYCKLLVFLIPITISMILFKESLFNDQVGLISWFVKTCMVLGVNVCLFLIIDFIFYRDELKEIKNFFLSS